MPKIHGLAQIGVRKAYKYSDIYYIRLLDNKTLVEMCNKRYKIQNDINAGRIQFDEGAQKILITLDCALHPEKYDPQQFAYSKSTFGRRGRV